MQVSVLGGPAGTVVSNIDYNARGQRVLYEYADPTNTGGQVTCQVAYTYDPDTFRLTNLVTTRAGNGADVTAAKLQDLLYTYDPAGNIVELDDNADTAPIFSGTTPVTGNGFYRYDSLYRLIYAEGREHPGQQQPTGSFEIQVSSVPHPNDMQALLRYVEQYSYDPVGNIQNVAHTTTTSGPNWTRAYQYAANSNQLTGTSAPGDPAGAFSDTYTYSGNGAMTHMSSLSVIEWDYADRMRHVNKGGGGDVFFTYSGNGQRVRKVSVPNTTTITERIYIGGWETMRSRAGGAISSPVTLERETLHVMDDKRRVAMVETKTIDTSGTPTGPLWRFQLGNLLDSAVMELDAQGRVITYEEYHPFGSTAFHSAAGASEVSPKRYRYTGKEKDEETGLYYHGARYYVPWLGRWTAADPAGAVDGPNLYQYVRNNPLRLSDPEGTQSDDRAQIQGFGLTLSGNKLTVGPLSAPSGCDELNPVCRGLHFDLSNHSQGPARAEVTIPPPRPQEPPARGFFSRGGGTLLGGAATLGVGLLVLATGPVGIVGGLIAALAIAGGTATTAVGAVELGSSYAGQTTAEQDAETNKAASTVLGLSSPGGLVGGTIGLVTGGDEGLQKGAFYGGLAEGGASLALGAGRLALREVRFGLPANTAWRAARPAIQDAYELTNPALRVRPNPAFPRGLERIELSHWIPQRAIGGPASEALLNRPWNVTPLWAGEHALVDPARLVFLKQPFRAAYEAAQYTGLTRQLRLAPPSLLQVGYGAARSAEAQYQLHLGQ